MTKQSSLSGEGKTMKDKYFDRTMALEAMYELRTQKFKDITLKMRKDGTLFLGCNPSKETSTEPKIDLDASDDWTLTDWGIMKEFDYWWIFD